MIDFKELFMAYHLFMNKHRVGLASVEVLNCLVAAVIEHNEEMLGRLLVAYPELEKVRRCILSHRQEIDLTTIDGIAELFSDQKRELQILEAMLIGSCWNMEELPWNPGVSLDIGRGWPFRTMFLKSKGVLGGRTICLDISGINADKTRDIALKEKVGLEYFGKWSCLELPLPDESVGQIWNVDALCFAQDWEDAVREMVRVLSKRGRMLIVLTTMPKKEILRETWDRVASSSLQKAIELLTEFPFPPEELVEFLRSFGLRAGMMAEYKPACNFIVAQKI